eukprot:4275722-Heterocapsa_arctica.AAC.1
MDIVYYAVKRTRESIIYGENVERLTSTQILDTVRFFKPDKKQHNQPECFWNAGVVTTDWTTLPESEPMRTEDLCHECK